MPDERLITEIESILQRVVELGAEKERTRLGPGLLVTNSAPAGLTNYVLVRDDRDGDNILALKVPGVIYNTNDLVNVLFVRGGEAIAIQQATGSSTAGIWGLVPATSTDIFYNSGDVGIGKAVAPDARLEILDTAQAQLRLTYTEDTKFVNFTLDTNHDLTIKPSSTGQVIFQPTTDSTDFFQVLDADGGTPIFNVDSTNEKVSIGSATADGLLSLVSAAAIGSVLTISGTNTEEIIEVTATNQPSASTQILRFIPTIDPQASPITNVFGVNINPTVGGSTSNNISTLSGILMAGGFGGAYGGTINTRRGLAVSNWTDTSSGSPSVTNQYGIVINELTYGGNNWSIYTLGETRSYIGAAAVNTTADAKVHIRQGGTGESIPVILLDQTDLSEEFIDFATTVGAGNPIDTAAIGTYYGKARVAVNGTFKYVALYNS